MSMYDEYIARGERFLKGEGGDGALELVELFCGVLANDVENYKAGLRRYRMRINGSPAYTEGDARHDVEILIGKMKGVQEMRSHEERVAELNAAQRGATVVIQDVGNATSSSTATAASTVTISQAIDAVDADPELSVEQKIELQSLLVQAKGAAAKGDKGLFARMGSKIMEGVEKAAPPLIVKVLEFLVSQAVGL